MNCDRRTFIQSAGSAIGAATVLGGVGTAAAAGSYTNHTHDGFDYWKYVPDGVGAGDPLVVMLHGCSQTADQFREETRMNEVADSEGFAVIYPDQYNARNGALCWNWFYDANTTRGDGEAAVIAGMTQETIDAEGIDSERVYVAGLSAGAAMVPNLLAEYADLYAAGGVHSGLEYDAADTAYGGTTAMTYGGPDPQDQGTDAYETMEDYGITSPVPTIVFHGTDDTTVYPVNGHQAAEQATQTNDLASDGADDDDTDYAADAVSEGSSEGYGYTTYEYRDDSGDTVVEKWMVEGMDHAWSGGASGGEFTAPGGPDASRIIWEFFEGRTNGE
ncbi:PHB depolymerase family esterase [Halorussus sp. MSC15.2]|uniref:extracellular catalytic domain type 1 short-chain-length polyhydroxyalkanoate depolymerase n=1 Tax=Halorussus sp. MSC15.2 TaxID=2283638 RepID=UPI0013D21309|nr:PHB depolymerase family esterase [Halorussus sp. MSC15.2]NEU58964.1 PHB depolymerase family esterase [Halorussus sp. MSC15.2]